MKEKTIKDNELLDVLRRMNRNELFSFFEYSCASGHLDLCQLCLDAGENMTHSVEGPILVALVRQGIFNTKAADWLIEKGIDLNACDDIGYSALTYACSHGNFDCAKYLIDKGAIIYQCKYKFKKRYESDLCVAINSCSCNIAQKDQYVKIVRLLLEKGVDLEVNNKKFNPLEEAIKYCYSDIIELFLKRGISPDYKYKGLTLLQYAVTKKETKMTRLLLEYNADVNAKIKDTNTVKKYLALTPMDIAVSQNDAKMQELLLEFGGSTSSKEERIDVILKNNTAVFSKIKKVLESS